MWTPFDTPMPVVTPPAFYGHKEIVKQLVEKLTTSVKPMSYQVVGIARIGKSSLLNLLAFLNDSMYTRFFQDRYALSIPSLKRLANAMFIPLNFAELADRSYMSFWRLMGDNLQKAASEQLIGWDMKTRKREYRVCTQYADFVTILEEIKALQSPVPQLCIFLMDQFDVVMQEMPVDVLNNLRHLIEKYQGMIVLITTTRRPLLEYYKERKAQEHWEAGKGASPLYTYFDTTFYLGLFTTSEATEYIKASAQSYGVDFTDKDIDVALALGGCHPALTRMICHYIFEFRRLYHDTVVDVPKLQDDLYDAFEQVYHDILLGLTEQQQSLWRAIANGETYGDTHSIKELERLGLIVQGRRRREGKEIFAPVIAPFLQAKLDVHTRVHLIPDERRLQFDNDAEVVLSQQEWKLFEYLNEHRNQTCTRDAILAGPFQHDTEGALNNTIARLRQKIGSDPNRKPYIKTIWGSGWCLLM